jgi:ferritin-like metal-binding protein YciE
MTESEKPLPCPHRQQNRRRELSAATQPMNPRLVEKVCGSMARQAPAGYRTTFPTAMEAPMGLFTTPIGTLNDLFVHTLQDIYYAERQIINNLPVMIGRASNPELKNTFQQHLAETEGQVRRLEQVFQMYGQPVKGADCRAMDGILTEAKEVISDCADADVCDAAMLSAAQAVEHYEISRYGTLVSFAKQLGRADCANILQQTLEEEKATDRKLTAIAESRVNRVAA